MGEIIDIRRYRQCREAEEVTRLEFEARKIFLEGYMAAQHKLRSTEMELEELEMDYGPGARAIDGMPGGQVSDGSDKIINRMARKEQMYRLIMYDHEKALKERKMVVDAIDGISQDKLASVLRFRYINDMDIGQIADEMHYSYKQILNIHKEAVRMIKPPRYKIQKIKADLLVMHPDWANEEIKLA